MGKEIFIVDRIEGESIVLEDCHEEIIIIDSNDVESIPCEGDVLIKEGNLFHIDKEETEKRKERIKNLMKGMWD